MAFSTFQGPNFLFEVIQPGAGSLPELLMQRARAAKAAGRVPCAYLTATWCGANKKLENALGDSRMQHSLRDVDAASFDIDRWGTELQAAGLAIATVPAFFILDEVGKPTKAITGAAWKEDTPENMAPPLDTFFDAARLARSAAAPVAAPAAPPSRGKTFVMIAAVILAVITVGVVAWLKVSSDSKAQHEQFEQEQRDRIKKDVDDAIHHRH